MMIKTSTPQSTSNSSSWLQKPHQFRISSPSRPSSLSRQSRHLQQLVEAPYPMLMVMLTSMPNSMESSYYSFLFVLVFQFIVIADPLGWMWGLIAIFCILLASPIASLLTQRIGAQSFSYNTTFIHMRPLGHIKPM